MWGRNECASIKVTLHFLLYTKSQSQFIYEALLMKPLQPVESYSLIDKFFIYFISKWNLTGIKHRTELFNHKRFFRLLVSLSFLHLLLFKTPLLYLHLYSRLWFYVTLSCVSPPLTFLFIYSPPASQNAVVLTSVLIPCRVMFTSSFLLLFLFVLVVSQLFDSNLDLLTCRIVPLPPLTLRTMLSSMFVFLLLPCLPISVISSWQKGLGRMSHWVKNFLHSTI